MNKAEQAIRKNRDTPKDSGPGIKPSRMSKNLNLEGHDGNFQSYQGRTQSPPPLPPRPDLTPDSGHAEAIEKPRFQQNQLLVSGLSALTTKDCLVNFMEAMSGGEVEHVMMIKDKALITMANDITDFSKVKAKGEERGVDSAKVTIEQVPVCTSIVVSGISDNTTRDAIELYFESQRYGGGPVERVEFIPKGGRAVVVFQDPKDVKGVLARQKQKPHVLNKAQLLIRIYHKFLESEEGDVPDESEMKVQKLHIAVDPDAMEFVTNSAFHDELINSLTAKKCKITWKTNSKTAVIVYQG